MSGGIRVQTYTPEGTLGMSKAIIIDLYQPTRRIAGIRARQP